jgi:hypothetical protein
LISTAAEYLQLRKVIFARIANYRTARPVPYRWVSPYANRSPCQPHHSVLVPLTEQPYTTKRQLVWSRCILD